MKTNYALVIGGSGMLRKVCHHLAEKNKAVVVIGRNHSRLESVKKSSGHPEKIHGISVNYEDSERFSSVLKELFETRGVPCWL